MEHLSGALDEDDDGFITAVCTCGWRQGPCPDQETALDVLMEHAYERGVYEGQNPDWTPQA